MIRLAHLDDIPEGGAKGFEVSGRRLFAVKRSGRIQLYVNDCPHLGIPLDFAPDAFLDKRGDYIQCSNHGALFRIEDGHCVAGPCAGEGLTPVNFTVTEGALWVDEPR